MTVSSFISLDIRRVDNWPRTEEVPTGSREKITVIDPDTGQHFIFKYPKERREQQIWSELLASFIAGEMLGWDVQHTSIAERDGRVGNLLRYVFEPGGENAPQEIFVEGWTLCTQIDQAFDVKRGTRHTLPLLFEVCDKLLVSQYRLSKEAFLDFWAKAFAFDCLISNTDRHAENWAVISNGNSFRMAPLYDNGSSLGCGLDPVGLERAFGPDGCVLASHLEAHAKNGCHHVRLDQPSKSGAPFEAISSALLSAYPSGRRRFEAIAELNIEPVQELMAKIGRDVDIAEPYRLSERRQRHIYAILKIGQERIRNILR